jgi:hypothetical protein
MLANTTFLLGAGASCDYGMPLGSKLKSDILELWREGTNPHVGVADKGKMHLLFLSEHPQFAEFGRRFQESGLASIDKFLSMNSEFTEIGKLAIATVLLEAEKGCSIAPNVVIPSFWIDILWDKLTDEIGSFQEFSFSNIAFVTFNYDRLLEVYLLRRMKGAFGISDEQAYEKLQSLSLVHVYGQLGSLKEGDRHFIPFGHGPRRDFCLTASECLQVIPEHRDESESIDAARAYLNRADTICILGFGFDALNMKRLDAKVTLTDFATDLNGHRRGRTVVASGLGLTQAQTRNNYQKSGGTQPPHLADPKFTQFDCWNTLRETIPLG